MTSPATCIAFEGVRRIASGALKDVAVAVKAVVDRGESAPVLIFDSVTSQPVEFDLRGPVDEVIGRLAGADVAPPLAANEEAPRGRGRPKLGVVAREVTLLPRHWDWLNGQPGGASVALRRLVDAARAANEDHDRVRRAQEATYRFMTALAGNLAGFEDATRALFANDRARFDDLTAPWPTDVRDHVRSLSEPALGASA
ncbi:DUF2239 family protein [Paraburkholderia sartisoli]|uniref:DUF2239 domain-containing protein n=1 Tax=Paraburkholderia sartisoli TaxID=83784 RepID=A0A1H3XZZ3_9BURK|nr:DUF2239 family protein [Paraburkholderia sartisoli]SEA04132.1 hypothetical protein SAMN05192564_10167 [Paraburkholderia sartisoli]